MQQTLALVKPDAYEQRDAIVRIIKGKGLQVVKSKPFAMTRAQAAEFYRDHKTKFFFEDLIWHMSSGPILVMVLERSDPEAKVGAVNHWREVMGHKADPHQCEPGTIRNLFWNNKPGPQNVTHGSDSEEAAKREIAFFFSGADLIR